MPGSLRAKLTVLYEPLLDELFDRPEVVEDRATCEKCAMCDHGQGVQVAIDFFHPESKCCTYYPTTPNFLVGGVLADPSPELEEGRRRLRKILATRMGVTPLWMAPPRKYSIISLAARTSSFGRTPALRCPYYDVESGGRCTIWKYRENVCATYFCKYTSGKPGWDFWQAMKTYLGHVEVMLSNYAARTIDPTLKEPTHPRLQLTLEDVEDRPPGDAEYASYWGKWVGREEEFYVKCYEVVKEVRKDAFRRFVDQEERGRNLLNAVRVRWDEMLNRSILPTNLVKNPKMKDRYVDDSVVITSYNPFDSFKMDRDLFDLLAHFKAEESVEKNLERLRDQMGAELEPDLLQYLYTHGVLVRPGEDLSKMAAPVEPIGPAATAAANKWIPAGAAAPRPTGGPAPSKVIRSSKKKKRR